MEHPLGIPSSRCRRRCSIPAAASSLPPNYPLFRRLGSRYLAFPCAQNTFRRVRQAAALPRGGRGRFAAPLAVGHDMRNDIGDIPPLKALLAVPDQMRLRLLIRHAGQ